ncbi:MAG: hypothetical protein K2P70_03870 [Hyphomonadaceae bacterium]|nr:hypothetical protein [Hyphomonadaceae bacterium]
MLKHALFALALLASPAFADPPEEELTAAPGSIAYGMIEEANADGVFDIVHNGQVSVRHLASGLRCDFERNGEGSRIVIFSSLPRGEDVACDTRSDTEFVTIYATRYPDGRNLATVLNEAEAAIHNRFPGATPAPAAVTVSSEDLPEQRARHFLVDIGGRPHFTSVAVAQANGWTYKVRFTTLIEDDSDLMRYQLQAGLLLTGVLLELEETH